MRTHLLPNRRGAPHRAARAAEAAERLNRDCSLSQKTKLLQLLLSEHLVGFGVARCCAVARGDVKACERVWSTLKSSRASLHAERAVRVSGSNSMHHVKG